MRIFDDPRWSDRLAGAERTAIPHFEALGVLTEEPGFTPFTHAPAVLDATVLEAIARIPERDVPDVRLALLRRVGQSDTGTSGSPHAVIRAQLAERGSLGADDLELELALCRFAMDLGFGVSLAWLRVGLLDPALTDLERLAMGAAKPELLEEVDRVIELLADDTMTLEAASTDRRFKLLSFRMRTAGGALPATAFDRADAFGAAMLALIETDADLAHALGPILPIAAGATASTPGRRQLAAIGAIRDDDATVGALRGALPRCIHQLLQAPLVPRGPGFVTVRPSNQRLARAVLWLVPSVLPQDTASLLGEVGLRMGTSGRRDNQARDTALANTCAALLGTIDDEAAVASLARMQSGVRNRPARKQVEKALTAIAARRGVAVADLAEASLPTFGLDAEGRHEVQVGSWVAEIEVDDRGRPRLAWISPQGEPRDDPPRTLRIEAPGEVAHVKRLIEDLRSALAEERGRLEGYLAEPRPWPVAAWRRRFVDHPLARVHSRRLVWRFTAPEGVLDLLTLPSGSVDARGRPATMPEGAEVELWHPVSSTAETVEAWRDLLVERRIEQPFKQAFRETYRPTAESDVVLETRFADRPLAYAQLRALAGGRGWTAPLLGPFDQGDRAVASRDFPSTGLRAELEHMPAGLGGPRERVEYARSGSLRFTSLGGGRQRPTLLAEVPPRVFSEALRDVDLFTSVTDLLRMRATVDADASPLIVSRAAALRRLIELRLLEPGLPAAATLAVLGMWLRVGHHDRAWLISLTDGTTLRLPEEEPIVIEAEGAPAPSYLPFQDDVLRTVVVTAVVLLGRG